MEPLQRAAGHLVAAYVRGGTTLHLANPGPTAVRVSEVKTIDPDQLFAQNLTVGPYGHKMVAITADGGPLFVEDGGGLVGTLER